MAYKTCYLVQFFGVNLGGIGAALIGCAPFQPYFCPAALRPLSRLAALGTAAPKPGSKRSPAACPLAAQRAARGLAPAACGLGARASARAARGAHVAAPPASRKSARGTLSPEPKRPPGSPGNGEGRRGGFCAFHPIINPRLCQFPVAFFVDTPKNMWYDLFAKWCRPPYMLWLSLRARLRGGHFFLPIYRARARRLPWDSVNSLSAMAYIIVTAGLLWFKALCTR